MAEGPHLGHRLPWRSLGQVTKRLVSDKPQTRMTEQDEKTIEYFARCFTDAAKEFAETDTTLYEDKGLYDPHRYAVWNVDFAKSVGAYAGYYDSLIWGYVHLNLLLLDPDTWKHIVLREGGLWTYEIELLCGINDGRHPDWLANHLRPAFDEHGHLKPVTGEIVTILRNHCKLLFRCLYSISRPVNSAFDWEFVKYTIASNSLLWRQFQSYRRRSHRR